MNNNNIILLKFVARFEILLIFLVTSVWVFASTPAENDGLTLTRVADNVYSAIGETGPPTYENGGHNNNLSIVITTAGVIVFNGGDSYRLARRLHVSIKSLTELPVLWVVNENGQGHSFLGNSYWRDQEVSLIAHVDAIHEMRSDGERILERMKLLNRDKSEQTYVAIPQHPIETVRKLRVGDTAIELHSFGAAHSPGDISLWLPGQKILISGDIAFHQRLLAIFPETNVVSWIESFDKMAELAPEIIIPGHGEPTDLETVRWTTRGYLQFLTREIEDILDEDGDLGDAYKIDQSAYAHLNTFKELAVKNAGRLFQTMEMEAF
jgi:glyoxylase-like metal-dependent hydrolase (beta-lactamase superfamily II)